MEGKHWHTVLHKILSMLSGGATDSAKFDNPQFSNCILQIEVLKYSNGAGSNVDEEGVIFNVDQKSKVLSVQRIHVDSFVLTSKSPFFLKLFSNVKKESDRYCPVIIRIDALEEAAFMELLHFMYGMKLTESLSMLFNVMRIADKFQVASCTEQCIRLLVDLPMTRESALVCLDIPSDNSRKSKYRQQLIDKAKEFLASSYKDLENFEDEICNMKFTAIEAVLSGDKIWTSEDEVFEIVIKWARMQFPGLQQRQEALGSCITRLVRFPFMTNRKLREVLECEDLNGDFAKDVVNEALLFKAEALYGNGVINPPSNESNRQFVVRAYMKRIIFYDLSLEDCKKLKLEGIKLYSEEFLLGKQPFSLSMIYEPSIGSFGLFLSIQNTSLEAIEVEGEFAVKKKPEMVFVKKFIFKSPGMLYKDKYTCRGTFNLVHMPWESFISDNSPYFIDGVLHLKVDLSVVE